MNENLAKQILKIFANNPFDAYNHNHNLLRIRLLVHTILAVSDGEQEEAATLEVHDTFIQQTFAGHPGARGWWEHPALGENGRIPLGRWNC